MRAILYLSLLSVLCFLFFSAFWFYDYLFLDDAAEIPQIEYSGQSASLGHLCVAYNQYHDGDSWGTVENECPPNYAFYAVDNGTGENKSGPGKFVEVSGYCCQMPFEDVLTDEHIYDVIEACPDNSVMTSGSGKNCGSHCGVRCTKINLAKYKLGIEHQSFYWRQRSAYSQTGRGGAKKLFHDNIPVGIRYAVGRTRYDKWHGDGCVGVPFGSLLVRKSAKRCEGFYYRQLLFLDGTAVRMFPECSDIDDPFDPQPECVVQDVSS